MQLMDVHRHFGYVFQMDYNFFHRTISLYDNKLVLVKIYNEDQCVIDDN